MRLDYMVIPLMNRLSARRFVHPFDGKRRFRLPHTSALNMAVLALLAMFVCFGEAGAAEKAAPPPAGKACTSCHDDSEAKVHAHHSDCLSCHTDAEAHRNSKKILPNKDIASETCLTCHGTGKGHTTDANRMNFAFSEHNKAGVKCADCHGIHKPKIGEDSNIANLKMDKNAQLCATCHQDILARFNMISHHPLREGAISCTNCHNQHDSKQTTLVSKTEQCTKCHQAVRGPHVFEHPPAAEDCANCHNPHGTPNRRLLEVAMPMQCLQCHSLPNNRHGQTASTDTGNITTETISGAVLRNCVNCHGAIHGSAFDQHLRH
ncbi:cytochrome c3 family protein [Methylococcus sp. EFPC2]|uniref:cytochrome c3 family protein n=1 Tax=Methylococcus sp. EFPC2 TaxID=2812648 RepID=UPI0019674116|nr:cytochrome c3 family protein [Methylococcus sp. EFPC2]QSA97432.1 cytochrome c3 family protein [Methylococcus sp. EFPC2]